MRVRLRVRASVRADVRACVRVVHVSLLYYIIISAGVVCTCVCTRTYGYVRAFERICVLACGRKCVRVCAHVRVRMCVHV